MTLTGGIPSCSNLSAERGIRPPPRPLPEAPPLADDAPLPLPRPLPLVKAGAFLAFPGLPMLVFVDGVVGLTDRAWIEFRWSLLLPSTYLKPETFASVSETQPRGLTRNARRLNGSIHQQIHVHGSSVRLYKYNATVSLSGFLLCSIPRAEAPSEVVRHLHHRHDQSKPHTGSILVVFITQPSGESGHLPRTVFGTQQRPERLQRWQ